MSPTFRSLRIRNYRLWASGAIVSNSGTWMQRVAQDWLVLTGLTHSSGLAVGITTGLQFGPALVLAPLAGVVVDRWDRRKILMATQGVLGLLALAQGVLVLTGVITLWQVYLVATLLGVTTAIDSPARLAFVSDMVPPADLPNALGLNSASFHAGRLIGPGLAGLLIHWFGTGAVFGINGLTFGAVLLSLTRMRVSELRPAPGQGRRERGALRAGFVYVRGRPDLVLLLSVVGVVGMFGLNFQLTMALMARLAFHQGSGGYGLLGSIMAVGSLGGALLAARREHPSVDLVLGAAAAFGVFTTVAALMPTYALFAVALIPVGLSSLTLMTAANATLQLSTVPAMRGRVMALYLAVFMGGAPIGSPLVGWVGEVFGPRWSILMGSCAAFAVAGVGFGLRYSRPAAFRTPVGIPVGIPVGTPVEPVSAQAEAVPHGLVPHEGDDVEQRVGDDQWSEPASAAEPLGEDHAHHGVPQERAEPLVEVVGAAQDGTGGHRGRRRQPQLP